MWKKPPAAENLPDLPKIEESLGWHSGCGNRTVYLFDSKSKKSFPVVNWLPFLLHGRRHGSARKHWVQHSCHPRLLGAATDPNQPPPGAQGRRTLWRFRQ